MKAIDNVLLDEMTARAVASERKRVHHNLHSSMDDPTHRLLIAPEPGTYIRPHRHLNPPKWELFGIIRGRMFIFEFDKEGKIVQKFELKAGSTPCFVESKPETWHGFTVIEHGTIGLEIKPGPYVKPGTEDVADWAPAEGEPRAAELEKWLKTAQVGDCWK
ncbi:MAG: WbuC family cupin fold metalloprotein [Victivallaceae bacterium]|nr:WbuC family cupin fold metalloprotein [Victivallaceae bacterium]